MSANSIATRYARALLDIGVDNKKVDAFAKDLGTFCAVWDSSAELRLVLTNPGIPLEQQQGVASAVLAKVMLDKTVANFVRLLVDRGRIGLVAAIAEAYQTLADETVGRVRGVVHAATKLTPMQAKKLTEAVSKLVDRQVVLEPSVDESLIGGVRVEIGGRVFDSSVRGHLDRIREQLA